jgi:hypothetical protein
MSPSTDKETDRKFPIIFRVAFVVMLTLVLILMAEVGLRLFGPNLGTIRDLVEATDDPRPYVLKANNTIRFEGLHVSLAEPVTWVINDQGIRADRSIPPYSDKFRVTTYGDSETFGWSVDYDDTFQRQMETIDGDIEVINFGVPGYNVTNVADTIELTALTYHPDLIIYLIHKNDFDDPLEAGEVVANSSLLRLIKFAYYIWIDKPREKKLRSSPARMERFVREIDHITQFCDRNNIPLVFAFLKWQNRQAMIEYTAANRGSASGLGTHQQAWGLPRHLNVHQIITDDEKMDSHFTKDSYRKIARFLCAAISGTQNSGCLPSGWQPHNGRLDQQSSANQN